MPPCSDGGPCYTHTRTEYRDNPEMKKRLDKATRAACDMRTILRRFDLEKHLADETREWIKGHDEADRKRIAQRQEKIWREEQRKIALNNLTEADKIVLGMTSGSDKARQAALSKLTMDQRRILGL